MTPPTTDQALLVHAYLDGELDPTHGLEIERQLAAAPELAAERDRIEALRQLIAERLPHEAPPPGLARRIEAAVGIRPASSHPSWRALAASMLLAAFVGGGATWFAVGPGPDPTADIVVASHMRALMAPQPIDVSSSDRHAVKPWFNGRVTEAPRVVDLTGEGFPLVGGRVDVIGRVPVPTLVYRHRQHLISLSAVPAGSTAVTAPSTIAGYNIVTWTQNGIIYWAVSDLAATDLEKFTKAFRDAGP
jgi:anti-sigma factor RsiW